MRSRLSVYCLIFLGFTVSILPVSASPEKPVIALVLSGGGAAGFAHVGIIEAIEAEGIPIDIVVGTSMGSLIGGLYVTGYSPEQIRKVALAINWAELFDDQQESATNHQAWRRDQENPLRIGFNKQGTTLGSGLISGQNLFTLFSTLTLSAQGIRDFDRLPVRYRSVATNLISGEKVVFSGGNIADAMRASMSIPGVFSPHEVGGQLLVDGGLVDNMPVELARSMGADIVIAVEAMEKKYEHAEDFQTPINTLNQMVNLFIEQNMKPSRAQADLAIKVDLHDIKTSDFARVEDILRFGTEYASQVKPALNDLSARIAKTRPLLEPGTPQQNRSLASRHPFIQEIKLSDDLSNINESEKEKLVSPFLPLLHKQTDPVLLKNCIDSAYNQGGWERIWLDFEPLDNDTCRAVIHTKPLPAIKHAFRAAIGYEGAAFHNAYSSFQARASLELHDVTVPGSSVFAEIRSINTSYLYLEYLHPLSTVFSLMPYGRFESSEDTSFSDQTEGFRTAWRHNNLDGGLWLCAMPGKRTELRIGSVMEYMDLSAMPGADPLYPKTLAHLFYFETDTRNYVLFPDYGFRLAFYAGISEKNAISDVTFRAANLITEANFKVTDTTTLGIGFSGATDFSFLVNSPKIPEYRQFDLAEDLWFPGYQGRNVTGSHKLSFDTQLRFKLGPVSRLLGGEVFAIIQGDIGNCSSLDTAEYNFTHPEIDVSAGIGVRPFQSTGLLLRFALPKLRYPCLVLNIGSFISSPEDLR